MIRWRAFLHRAILVWLSLTLVGCFPSTQGNLDEQKDPHYLNGRARVTSLDYKGAILEFEKALESNPRNSSAHLELALLYEEQMKEYATAIYHYEQHLKIRPGSDYADRAKERIKACKMDLVKTEVLGPVNQGMQQEMERLTTENILLKQRVEHLEAQLTGRLAPPANRPPAGTPQAPASSATNTASNPVHVSAPSRNPSAPTIIPPTASSPAPRPAARIHTVKSGDKLTVIARDYGVDLARLLQANPGVDPSRLQIGQKINIP